MHKLSALCHKQGHSRDRKFADTFAAAGRAGSYYRSKFLKSHIAEEGLLLSTRRAIVGPGFGVVIIQVMLTLHLPGIPQPSTGMGQGMKPRKEHTGKMLQSLRAWKTWVSIAGALVTISEPAQATKLPYIAFFLCKVRMSSVIHQKFIQLLLRSICWARWKYKALSPFSGTHKLIKTRLFNKKQYSIVVTALE